MVKAEGHTTYTLNVAKRKERQRRAKFRQRKAKRERGRISRAEARALKHLALQAHISMLMGFMISRITQWIEEIQAKERKTKRKRRKK